MTKFDLYLTRNIGRIGHMRSFLAKAKFSRQCEGFTEVGVIFRKTFYITGATEGLARSLVGSGRIDALYAMRNQSAATSQPGYSDGLSGLVHR
jgi:hypothetical protein